MSQTGLQGVVAAGALRGFSYFCTTPLTILLEGSPDDGSLPASAVILRLLAGIGRPQSGHVFTLGVDPTTDASLRRSVALLGDAVLLEDEPADTAHVVARLRGVTADLAPLIANAHDSSGRRALCDTLANASSARLVLLSFPERYLDPHARDAVLSTVRAALDRGAQAIVATRSLDEVLAFAPDDRAIDSKGESAGVLPARRPIAVIVANGVAAAAAPAHALPWAAPVDGLRTRVVRVVVGANGAAKLGSELLADEAVASTLTAVEPLSAEEVRFHTRDPRAVARAIAARAKDGLDVRSLTVFGATAAELLGGMR